MTRYTIDPAQFTEDEWAEFSLRTGTIVPQKHEFHADAKPFNRSRKQIHHAVVILRNRADEIDEGFAHNLEIEACRGAAAKLEALIPAEKIGRKAAKARLYDLLTSDIYTDAPEYADRVSEIYDLIPLVFGGRK